MNHDRLDTVKIEPTEAVSPIDRARYWVQAVEYQARRVTAIHAAPWELQNPCAMDEHFLLIAVGQALRWLDKAIECDVSAEIKTAIGTFEEVIGEYAKDLRDFREHGDEYDLGKGWNRDRLPHVVKIDADTSFEVNHRLNVIHRDGGTPIGDRKTTTGLRILLGGRFDVVAAQQAAAGLAAILVEQLNKTRPGDPIAALWDDRQFPPDGYRR